MTLRIVIAVLIALHALLHLLGFVKAFGFAPVPRLRQPISRAWGVVWLLAAALLLGAGAMVLLFPPGFWLLGAAGLLLSQAAIVSAWRDARFGTLPNLLVLASVIYAAAAWGPFGLAEQYATRSAQQRSALARLEPAHLVTEAELAPLPGSVARYLRFVGALGKPHVRGFRARFTGRIRSGPDAPWMAFTGEQHNRVDPPARLFFLSATMSGLPVDVFHAYDAGDARMQVRLLSLFPVVDTGGQAFSRTETVTLFNDLCVMAPAALVDANVRWRELDEQSVEGTYTNGPHTISAVLVFDDTGALTNFWSDDRPALAPDGVSLVSQRWSTPLFDYRLQGAYRLAARGEGRYAPASGEYTYIEFDGLEVAYDLAAP